MPLRSPLDQPPPCPPNHPGGGPARGGSDDGYHRCLPLPEARCPAPPPPLDCAVVSSLSRQHRRLLVPSPLRDHPAVCAAHHHRQLPQREERPRAQLAAVLLLRHWQEATRAFVSSRQPMRLRPSLATRAGQGGRKGVRVELGVHPRQRVVAPHIPASQKIATVAVEGRVGLWVREEGDDGSAHGLQGVHGRPGVLEQVQANLASLEVDVGVEDLSDEVDLGRPQGVVLRHRDVQLKPSAFEGGVWWADDVRSPV